MEDAELQRVIGANVRAARERAGLTQDQFAEKCGIAKPHISRIESGGHSFTVKTLNRLARALGMEPADLLRKEAARG